MSYLDGGDIVIANLAEDNWMCLLCDRTFVSELSIRQHISANSRHTTTCSHCGLNFDTYGLALIHQRSHVDGDEIPLRYLEENDDVDEHYAVDWDEPQGYDDSDNEDVEEEADDDPYAMWAHEAHEDVYHYQEEQQPEENNASIQDRQANQPVAPPPEAADETVDVVGELRRVMQTLSQVTADVSKLQRGVEALARQGRSSTHGHRLGSPNVPSCPCCMDRCKDHTVTACGHMFCAECIADWLRREGVDARCPVCMSGAQLKDLRRVYI